MSDQGPRLMESMKAGLLRARDLSFDWLVHRFPLSEIGRAYEAPRDKPPEDKEVPASAIREANFLALVDRSRYAARDFTCEH